MKFGVFDHMDRSGPDLGQLYQDRLALVEAYDRAGFYGYHVAEHHGTPLGLSPSPSVFLSAVAQRTERLRFGPMVYVLSTYHPLRILEEICMLDQLSCGRLEVGIGRGISPIESSRSMASRMRAKQSSATRKRFLCFLRVAAVGPLLRAASTSASRASRWSSIRYRSRSRRCGTASLVPLPRIGLRSVASMAYVMARPALSAASRTGTGLPGSGSAVIPQDLPLLAMSRHIVVADSDTEVYEEARDAYDQWFANLNLLGRKGAYLSR